MANSPTDSDLRKSWQEAKDHEKAELDKHKVKFGQKLGEALELVHKASAAHLALRQPVVNAIAQAKAAAQNSKTELQKTPLPPESKKRLAAELDYILKVLQMEYDHL